MQWQFKEWLQVRTERDWLALALCGFAFFLPISISLAQPLAYAALVVWLHCLWKGAERPTKSPYFWPVLLFILLILFAALMGPRPEYSIPRSRRLLLTFIIFAMPMAFQVRSGERHVAVLTPLLCFLFGASLLGLWDLLRVPIQLSQGVSLFDTGNMRDPQLYMVGIFILLAVWIYRPVRFPPLLLIGVSVINALGMVLHFKRGVWISFALTALLVSALTRRYRLLVILLLGCVALLFIPQTRERIALLQEEFESGTGGRVALWTHVAPDMIQTYPLGTGFRGLTHQDFLEFSSIYLQPGLNHLHNNVLQLTVDAGWAGVLVWISWMLFTLFFMAQLARSFRRHDPVRATAALACLASFIALMCNGMVEYNFGNSVIFMTLMFLMGVSDVVWRSGPERAVDEGA